jgi:hypothetical protein
MSRREHEHGFTIVELTAALAFAVLMLLTLQTTLTSTVKTRERTNRHDAVQGQAYEYLQRLMVIPFGLTTDGAASALQLSELFDEDADLGNVTLQQVRVDVGQTGHVFRTLRDDVTTDWRVLVSNDLDRDGLTTGPREGRPDLLQIEVWADNRLMFRSLRAADFVNTRRD